MHSSDCDSPVSYHLEEAVPEPPQIFLWAGVQERIYPGESGRLNRGRPAGGGRCRR